MNPQKVLQSISALVLLSIPSLASAGLYYSGESLAELPSQWRGFLLDQRTLRNIAVPASATQEASQFRVRYLEQAEKLVKQSNLSADELADLGALHLRLGQVSKAIEVLRQAQRQYPNHFRIQANLGTAWQMQGDLNQAVLCLREAARLAPGKLLQAEEYHLKLVQGRLRKANNGQELDDLFGVKYAGKSGKFEPGQLAEDQKKKLPAKAVAIAQQLALWLPGDGPLLWQLAELANATGDIRTAAALMEGCVTAFGMQNPELRRERQALRLVLDELPKAQVGEKKSHDQHASAVVFRSRRPLIFQGENQWPEISATGTNLLPWEAIQLTAVDDQYKPTFPKYLQELEGKQVALTGFMQPIGESPDLQAFLFIEFPVGCWYCEMPETANIVFVQLPEGKTAPYSRSLVRVTGRLTLNAKDPEDFLYALRDAQVGGVD